MRSITLITNYLALPFAAFLMAGIAHADDMKAMAAPPTPAPASAPANNAAKTANVITISNFTFSPQTLTVPAGTTVTWTNSDDTIHRVRIQDLDETSPALDTDQSFAYKFDKPGTYKYFCTMHPMMTGVVVIQAQKAD